MKIRVLGAHNTESRDTHHTTLLVDDILALDAGGLTSGLSFEDQLKLKAVLLTHHHYDHVRDIPALAMNFFLRSGQIDVFSHQAVFDNLAEHFLNGSIYPEYHEKPPGNPVLRFHILEAWKEVSIQGYSIKPVPMKHSQPSVGYQVTSTDHKNVFYSGDTGIGLFEVWKQIKPQLLFIEVTGPDKWENSMIEHKHMTPHLLKGELGSFREFNGYLPRIVVLHTNPASEKEISAELAGVAASLQADILVSYEGMQVEI